MATPQQHIQLYGRVRKVLLSRYFALGQFYRNDYFQESTSLDTSEPRRKLLKKPNNEFVKELWKKRAARDNPWLFGSKLHVALATEARLELPGADALLSRAIRSCEQLFKFGHTFRGLPMRWDPITSDDWAATPDDPNKLVCGQFLVRRDGKEYLYGTPPNDPRHFPFIEESTGVALMGRRVYKQYVMARNDHVDRYRNSESSQDELLGAVTTYVAVAEGTADTNLQRIARARLQHIAIYLAATGYLGVMPAGGGSSPGGPVMPCRHWSGPSDKPLPARLE